MSYSIPTLHPHCNDIHTVKRYIKQWENNFIRHHKSKPTMKDVRQNVDIERMYQKYESLKSAANNHIRQRRLSLTTDNRRAQMRRIVRGFIPGTLNSLSDSHNTDVNIVSHSSLWSHQQHSADENDVNINESKSVESHDVFNHKRRLQQQLVEQTLQEELPQCDKITIQNNDKQTSLNNHNTLMLSTPQCNEGDEAKHTNIEKKKLHLSDGKSAISCDEASSSSRSNAVSTAQNIIDKPHKKVCGAPQTSDVVKSSSAPKKRRRTKQVSKSMEATRTCLTSNFVKIDLKKGRGSHGRGVNAKRLNNTSHATARKWKSKKSWAFEQRAKRATQLNNALYTDLLDAKAREREMADENNQSHNDDDDDDDDDEQLKRDDDKNNTELNEKSECAMHYTGSFDAESRLTVLRTYFGHQHFLDRQEAAIERILHTKSTLLVLRTGGGKSLVYQLPALMLRGLVLIVTPLLSLMQDQLAHLPPCLTGAIWSSMQSVAEINRVIADIRADKIKVLFVSPERLHTQGFQRVMNSLAKPGIAFVCIDEAHCVSQWSHNFRPAFRRLNNIIKHRLHVPCVLALTATATTQTLNSICSELDITADCVLQSSVNRDNLFISVSRDHDRLGSLVQMLRSDRFCSLRSIIIYVHLQHTAEQLAIRLNSQGFKAVSYHAGKDWKVRRQIQDNFMSNRHRIVVATIAFGMGLDKQDVRAVIHYNTPQSMEHYIQEIGRAGRDGISSHCHTFFDEDDVDRHRSLAFSDGVEVAQVRHLLKLVFDTTNKSYPLIAVSKTNDALQLDMKHSVLETLLLYLELHMKNPPIIGLPSFHNIVSVRFFKTPSEVLAKQSRVIECILHESKFRSGSYTVNIVQIASKLSIRIVDVQCTLLTLKSMREVALVWKDDSFCVFVKYVPQQLNALAVRLTNFSRSHEILKLRKVNIIAQVLKSVAKERFSLVGDVESEIPTQKRIRRHIEKYFSCESDDELLKAVESDLPNFEKLEHCLHREPPLCLNSDIRLFLCHHESLQWNPRRVTRILHGVSSPLFSYKQWHKQASWGKYTSFPFEECMKLITHIMSKLNINTHITYHTTLMKAKSKLTKHASKSARAKKNLNIDTVDDEVLSLEDDNEQHQNDDDDDDDAGADDDDAGADDAGNQYSDTHSDDKFNHNVDEAFVESEKCVDGVLDAVDDGDEDKLAVRRRKNDYGDLCKDEDKLIAVDVNEETKCDDDDDDDDDDELA